MKSDVYLDIVVYTDGSHRHETLSRWDIQMDWPLYGLLVNVLFALSQKSAAEVAPIRIKCSVT